MMTSRKHDPLDYVRPNIRALKPYSTARDEFKGGDISIWLDANESPYPDTGLNRYPDPRHRRLKQAIGRLKGVAPDCVFIGGAGSDEAIDLVYRIFCVPGRDNVVAAAPTYGVYAVAADINDVEYREVAPAADLTYTAADLLAATDSRTKVIWICSPDNPTGISLPLSEIETVAREFDGIVAVDEAYIDFSTQPSALTLLARYPNLIVLQTFSKARGMASLRIGMAFATPAIAAIFANVKYPYNINGPTQERLLAMIDRDITAQVAEIREQREWLRGSLDALSCVEKVYPSDANFLLVKFDDADKVYDYLVSQGILVRNRNCVAHCRGCLRITVGTPDENHALVNALKRIL